MFKKSSLMLVVLALGSFFSVTALADSRVVSGFVKDENGNGVAGVYVTASDNACNGVYWQSSSASDSDGAFQIVLDDYQGVTAPSDIQLNTSSPEGTNYYVTYKGENAGSVRCGDAVSINVPSEGLQNVIVPINLGGRISGKVVDSNNLAVENLNVVFYTGCSESDQVVAYAATNADGIYSVAVPAGNLVAFVNPSSDNLPYLKQYWNGTVEGGMNCADAGTISVTQNVETSNVDFQLVKGSTIDGVVTDSNGNPVNGVLVYFSKDQCGNEYISETKTDANGAYIQKGLPIDIDIYVNTRAREADPYYIDKAWNSTGGDINCRRAEGINLKSDETRSGVNIVLDLGGIISGVVKDSLGNPIQGVIVEAYSEPCSSGLWLSDSVSDANGAYSIKGVPTGNVYLSAVVTAERVEKSEYIATAYWDGVSGSSTCEASVAFNVSSSTTYPETNFVLDVSGAVRGKIVDSFAYGINGLIVNAYANKCDTTPIASTYTTGDGDFLFQGLNKYNNIYIAVVDPNEVSVWIDGWFKNSGNVTNQCSDANAIQVILKEEVTAYLVTLDSIEEYAYDNLFEAWDISKRCVKQSKKSKLTAKNAKKNGKKINGYLDNLLNYEIAVKQVKNIKKKVKNAMKKNTTEYWTKVNKAIKQLLRKYE